MKISTNKGYDDDLMQTPTFQDLLKLIDDSNFVNLKEKVVIKYQTLIKEVQKRGEIKQDEKSDFTIVTF